MVLISTLLREYPESGLKEYIGKLPGIQVESESHSVMSDSSCEPMDCTIHGILQAKILEWVDFSFSRGSSQHRD